MPYKDIEKKKEYQRKLMAERRAKIKELKNVSPVSPNEKALDPNLNVIPENQKKDVIPVISEAIADFGLKSSSNVIPDLNVIPIKPASPVCETETREHRRVLVSVENSKPKLIADTTNLVVAEPLVLESVAKVSVNLKKEVDENAEALSNVEPKIVNQVELKLAPNVESVNANKNKNKAEREEQSKSEVIKISRVVPDEFLSKTDTSRKMVEGKEYVYINGRWEPKAWSFEIELKKIEANPNFLLPNGLPPRRKDVMNTRGRMSRKRINEIQITKLIADWTKS